METPFVEEYIPVFPYASWNGIKTKCYTGMLKIKIKTDDVWLELLGRPRPILFHSSFEDSGGWRGGGSVEDA